MTQSSPVNLEVRVLDRSPVRGLRALFADLSQTRTGKLVMLMLVGEFTLLVAVAISRLVYPFDGGHYESGMFSAATLAGEFRNPYGYALRPPYVMANYGYVYYLMLGIGIRAFGPHFWFGRLLSILAAVVCLSQIFRITRAVTDDLKCSSVAVLAFASCAPFQFWLAFQRADLVGLAFGLSAIALVVCRNDFRAGPFVAGVMCAAAILCKQTFVLPIVVVVAAYAQRRAWRAAGQAAVTAGVVLLSIGMALNATSDGGYVWQHFTLMQNIPVSGRHARLMALKLLRTSTTPILVAMLTLFLIARWQDARRRTYSLMRVLTSPRFLLVCYFLAAMALTAFATERWGSNINYYLEAMAAASVLVGMTMKDLDRWRQRLPQVGAAAVLAFAMLGSYYLLRIASGEYFHWRGVPYFRELAAELARHVPPDGVCVSVYADLAIAAGRQHHFDDWTPYYDGRLPELRKFIRQTISSGPYAAIIWHGPPERAGIHGFEPVPISQPVPRGVYTASLYARSKEKSVASELH